MTGVIPRLPPGPGPRRPHRLAALVFEDDPAAEGRRGAFIRGQVSVFHTSTAPSSRSMARRAPSWQVQPRRCSRYRIPGMVYCTLNLAAQPGPGPGPASTAGQSTRRPAARYPAPHPARPAAAHPAGTAPHARARPPRPGRPACQACRHRRTDRSLTRSSAAITPPPAPAARTFSPLPAGPAPRLRPSAVSPPPCAYRMHPAYRRKPHASAQRTSPIKDLLGQIRTFTERAGALTPSRHRNSRSTDLTFPGTRPLPR